MKLRVCLGSVILASLIAPPILVFGQGQSPETIEDRRVRLENVERSPARNPSALPAPRRRLTGHWRGATVAPTLPAPPMTAWGQRYFDAAKPLYGRNAFPIAQTNDPFVTCNPFGIPRAVLYEARGMAFEHLPERTLQLFMYGRVWREIWTDGRALPTNVGADTEGAPAPRYFGYSVGAWEDDYTFVVTTTGFNEDAWADVAGHPRSTDAKVIERYRMLDNDTLQLNVTIDDPKSYTKPWVVTNGEYWFVRMPKPEFDLEQLCIPSEAIEYRRLFMEAGLPQK